ncbi:EexN family lipoprotein [Herbaspirillum huttiense]|uniref:EexN family lipoprotein n=1 Tax=Herbaspirillum huttiense TaxID=863372 RepID=UPI0021769F57|nr:EexN family lipoprotein [Herbaspirillum huttiense]UWE15671.1 EexN family lipoprotein [Herbaspirillum huttiense]
MPALTGDCCCSIKSGTTKRDFLRMIHQRMLSIVVALSCVIMAGCDKGPPRTPKSLNYFTQHSDEAEQIANKCKAMEKEELSRMSPSQRLAWEETDQGVSCRNAVQARSDSKYSDYQRRMREEAKKYQ